MKSVASPYLAENVCPEQSMGEPMHLTVYRGEHGEGVLRTRLAAFSFGSRELAEIYALEPNDYESRVEEPKIIEATIFIGTPFVAEPDDPFLELGHIARTIGVEHAVRIAKKFSEYIENTGNWGGLCEQLDVKSVQSWLDEDMPGLDEEQARESLLEKLDCLYFDGYPYFDDHEEVQILRSFGFDGACMGSAGAGAGMVEYRVFDTSQIQVLSVEQLRCATALAHH